MKKDQVSTLLRKLPHVHKFTIPMVADSTNEVWVDISTLLNGNDAWEIVEVSWGFELIDPTTPPSFPPAAFCTHAFQIHRNCDNETLLNIHDDDVLFADVRAFDTTGYFVRMPFVVPCHTLTTQKRLRAIFRTSPDHANLSAATVHLSGMIKYHQRNGPNIGHTKLGRIKEF